MTTQLAALWTALGLLAIAGVFFLLHRLRVRQRTVVVETTLFWRQALEETRARVFVQRFRHPLVYAFLVFISALLWFAFAGLESTRSEDGESLVLIDGSAAMARGDRFEATLALVDDLVDDLPTGSRTVVLCGGRPRTVLRPGEHTHLLRERLANAAPEKCPSTIEGSVRQHLARSRTGRLRVYLAGDAVVDQGFLESLPQDATLTRLAPPAAEGVVNHGITALGSSPAASGAWDKVDLLVEVAATAVGPIEAPTLTIPGVPRLVVSPEEEKIGDGSAMRFVYRDLPAGGELLEVRVSGASDANPLDDSATFVLPERRRMRIAIEEGLPPVLTAVVEADPALALVTDNPDVVLRGGGSSFGGSAPAIEFVDAAQQENAFLIQCREDEDPNDVVLRLHDRLGLAEIDATDVAQATGRVIAMGAMQGSSRGLKVWINLLSSEFNFVQSRSFPLFIALGVRWIGGSWEPPPALAAGVPADLAGVQVKDADGRSLASLGDAFTPPTAAVFHADNGRKIAAALLDRKVTAPAASGAELEAANASVVGFDMVNVLLSLALGLLLIEWVLFQRGRLP